MPRLAPAIPLLALLGLFVALSVAPTPEAGASRYGKALQANAFEYAYVLSRERLSKGRIRVELVNRGEDAHNLRLSSPTRKRSFRWTSLAPGQSKARVVTLRPARWNLVCTLPGHRQLGMKAKVRVARN